MGATPLGRGSATVSLIVIESVGIVRASLRLVFAGDPDLMLLGEAEDADEGLELVASLRGQGLRLALVGLELGGDHDSFWLIRSLRERSPELIILATGADLHRGSISQGLFAGADGFVHKNSSPERFVEATRRAAAGEVVLEGLPRGALGGIVEGVESMERQRATTPILTDREKAVLIAAADGLTAREIGRRLGVSERTVTTHLNHIYRKLNVNSRVAALSAAWRLGLITTPVISVMARSDELVSEPSYVAVPG
jgi:DNA-binding NarL/FixJ family response regulator